MDLPQRVRVRVSPPPKLSFFLTTNSRDMDISEELGLLATACKCLQASLPALCAGGSMLSSEFLIYIYVLGLG